MPEPALTSTTARLPTALTYAVPIAVAVGWYLALGGGHTLVPTNIAWMMDGDWFDYLFSWLFYRNAPWGFPVGDIPDLIYPSGVTLALTDALPLVSTVLKVFSAVLPKEVQFYGFWMCSGYVGMAVLGVRLARRFTPDRVAQGLAGCLLAISPILSQRYGHPPFYGLWAVFALAGMCLVPAQRIWVQQPVAWLLLVFCCGTNAYLAVMALALAYAVALGPLARGEPLKPAALAALLLGPAASCVLGFWVFGYFASLGKVTGQAEGFGQFSADLTTLVNSMGWSRAWKGFPTGGRQYEGFAYLGLGNLFLLAAVPAVLWRAPVGTARWKVLWPLAVVVSALAVYSLSNVVTFMGRPVLDLTALYQRLGTLPSTFRSSGRFVWPLHATLVLGAIAVAARLSRTSRLGGRTLLAIAVVVQAVDVDFGTSPLGRPTLRDASLDNPAWRSMGHDYRHVALIPVQISWYSPFDAGWVAKLSVEAYRQKLTINSGYIGRAPAGLDWRKHLGPGELDASTVYVLYYREYLQDFLSQGFRCGGLDGMLTCVDPSRATPLSAAIDEANRVGAPYTLRSLN